MSLSPRRLVEQLEESPSLPAGAEERFNGYGVMGLPFTSGHILALRRFPATSVGPGYTSVWHRLPDGSWVFYSTVPPMQSCPRYFGEAASEAIETDIHIKWSTPVRLSVVMPAVQFDWDVEVRPTVAARLMNAMGRLLPEVAWHNPSVLAVMERMAGPLLGVGRVGLHGTVPNRQWFIANPRLMWAVQHSRAALAGEDFGAPGPVQPQAHLQDFWIPQRGMLAIGQVYLETFDPTTHSSRTRASRVESGLPADGMSSHLPP